MNTYESAITSFIKQFEIKKLFMNVKEEDYEEVADSLFKSAGDKPNADNFMIVSEEQYNDIETAKKSFKNFIFGNINCSSRNTYYYGYNLNNE